MKTIAFAGSNSATSINHQLVDYIASLLANSEVIRLTDYNIPIYSIDIENNDGIPQEVKKLSQKLAEADAFIISVNEYNGTISSFFQGVLEWLSRENRQFLEGKKVVLLSTSPGKNGTISALKITENMLPYFGAEIVATLSVGNFYEVFKDGILKEETIQQKLKEIVFNLK